MCVCVFAGGLLSSDSFLGGNRREKHYHKAYRKHKDEIRDFMGVQCGDGGDSDVPPSDVESFQADNYDKQYNRQRFNQYQNNRPDRRTFSRQRREEFCDNKATDSRSYTERRKKTVRFNSEGWNTVEDDDLDQNVDSRWTSSQSVYYDNDRSPPGIVPVVGSGVGTDAPLLSIPRDPGYAPLHQLPQNNRRLQPSWNPTTAVRELPVPVAMAAVPPIVVRKEPWEVERQESQDSQTKDSGIDSGTSSNFNSSEDSSKGDIPRSCRVGIQ